METAINSGCKRLAPNRPTKKSKRIRTLCDCELITPEQCSVCSKIARKIHRLYGKRLALSDIERSSKAPVEPPSGNDGDILILADQACECQEPASEDCPTCANFAIKMGAFINIYSKSKDIEEIPDTDIEPKYKVECRCAYLSNVGCVSCREAIKHIQSTFFKKVYPPSGTALSSESAPGSSPLLQDLGSARRVPLPTAAVPTPDNNSSAANDRHSPVIPAVDVSRCVALDCEMVGVIDHTQKNNKGRPKMVSALARCSIVDVNCKVLLDIYVRPHLPIADYRTKYSGIRKSDMKNAVSTIEARNRILEVIKDKIVIGHSIHNDFAVIGYRPRPGTYRDIVKCRRLREMYLKKSRITPGPTGGQGIGLKRLSAVLLNSLIQRGNHCSIEDAIHTMKLYLLVQDVWEHDLTNELIRDPDTARDLAVQCQGQGNMYLADSFWSYSTPE